MRCPWCGNRNKPQAKNCAYCDKDLVASRSTYDAIEILESMQVEDPEVRCPKCLAHNIATARFCSLCHHPLMPGVDPRKRKRKPFPWPSKTRQDSTEGMSTAVGWMLAISLGMLLILTPMIFVIPLMSMASSPGSVAQSAPVSEPAVPGNVRQDTRRSEEDTGWERALSTAREANPAKPWKAPRFQSRRSRVSRDDVGYKPKVAPFDLLIPLPAGAAQRRERHTQTGKRLVGSAEFDVHASLSDVRNYYQRHWQTSGWYGSIDSGSASRGGRIVREHSEWVAGRLETVGRLRLEWDGLPLQPDTVRIQVTYETTGAASVRFVRGDR